MKAYFSPGELAQLIFSAMNARNLSRLEQYLAENAVFDFPGAGRMEGARRILLFFKILFRKYTYLTFTLDDIMVDNDRVCVVWRNAGESSTGVPYTNRGVTVVHILNNKIIYISDYFKDTSFVVTA